MAYLRESPTDTSDPGNNSSRKMRADRMMQAIETSLDIARKIADDATNGDGAVCQETAIFQIMWIIDRASEGMAAASEFISHHWPEPERTPTT